MKKATKAQIKILKTALEADPKRKMKFVPDASLTDDFTALEVLGLVKAHSALRMVNRTIQSITSYSVTAKGARQAALPGVSR